MERPSSKILQKKNNKSIHPVNLGEKKKQGRELMRVMLKGVTNK